MICLTFLYITFFHIFLKVPMLSTRFSHPKVTTPPKQRASESSVSGRVLNPKVTRVVTFGTLRNSAKKRYYGLIPLGGFILLEFSSALICERRGAYGFAVTRFCSNLHFTCKLRYCGYTKPSGLRHLEIFRVISIMRFAVFLCCSVRCFYVFLCGFGVFVSPPELAPFFF